MILAVGPLSALYPRLENGGPVQVPPHGELRESHCGGRTAFALRLAGYGALVIEGRSDLPVYLAVHGERVFFRDARTLWGMSSSVTVGRILREREEGSGYRTILRIGRAGERG